MCMCVCVYKCMDIFPSENHLAKKKQNFKISTTWGLPEGNKLVAKPSQLLSSQLLTSSNSSFFTHKSLISSPISIQGPKSLLPCPCLSSLTTHCLQLGEPI